MFEISEMCTVRSLKIPFCIKNLITHKHHAQQYYYYYATKSFLFSHMFKRKLAADFFKYIHTRGIFKTLLIV